MIGILTLFSLVLQVDSIYSNLYASNLDSLKAANSLVLVQFTDYDGYTHDLTRLESDPTFSSLVIGHCNAKKNPDLSARFSVSGTPVYKLLKGDKVYHSAGDLEDVKKFIQSHMTESPKVISSQAALDTYVQSHEVTVVAFANGPERTVFNRMGDELRHEFDFVLADFESSKYSAPSVVVFHAANNAIVGTEVFTDVWAEGTIHKWLQTTAVPYFRSVGTWKEFANYLMRDDPVAFVISNSLRSDHQSYLQKFMEIAPRVREDAIMVHVDSALFPKEVSVLLAPVASSMETSDRTAPHGLMIVRNGIRHNPSDTLLHRIDPSSSHESLRAKVAQSLARASK